MTQLAGPSLRVLHVINNLPVGGAERFLLLLASAQRRSGIDAELCVLAEPNPLAEEAAARGIPTVRLGRGRLNDPRLLGDLVGLLRRRRPDVVHTHLFYADTFGRLAARIAGVPVVVSTEHSTEGAPLSRRRRAAMRGTARFAHAVVAVSDAVRAAAASRLGLALDRIDVVPNGIELEPFAAAAPLPRETLGARADQAIVGCVGRLDAPKGYDVLLEAVAQLHPPWPRIVVAGDGPLRGELAARARALGVQDTVGWLGWRNDVPRLLRTLDVFAMPSRWEGHSMALLEAMAAGCACVTSDIAELSGTMGDAGEQAPAGDAAALAAVLDRLLSSAEHRGALGARARRVASRYAIESSAARYTAIYAHLGAAPSAGRRPR